LLISQQPQRFNGTPGYTIGFRLVSNDLEQGTQDLPAHGSESKHRQSMHSVLIAAKS
jgi:hypothetical protein